MTKEFKTPNYPKEIEAKMKKEKTMSEKARNHYGSKDIKIEDVALAVLRLKEETKNNLVLNQSEINGEVLFLNDLFNEIDEIFGSFDEKTS